MQPTRHQGGVSANATPLFSKEITLELFCVGGRQIYSPPVGRHLDCIRFRHRIATGRVFCLNDFKLNAETTAEIE
jgi:hypothetical protein